jgi:hypothetical protein
MSDADRIQEGRPAAEAAPAGRRVHLEEYRHPSRVDRVRLVLYEIPEGYLVTQERLGEATVTATLGALGKRPEAEALLRQRARQLEGQGFSRADPAIVTARGSGAPG